MTKDFKVAARTDGYNEFGLRGMLLIAEDGEAWEVGADDLHCKPEGTVFRVPYLCNPDWTDFGFETTEKAGCAPPPIVAELWA